MNRFISVHALADAVLDTVVRDAQQKTASAPPPPKPKFIVPTAQGLRKMADDLRDAPDDDDEVQPEDLAALQQDPEVMQLLALIESNPEILSELIDDDGDEDEDAEDVDEPDLPAVIPTDAEEPEPEAALANAAKEASISLDLRKIAKHLRKKAAHTAPKRIKAAATLCAAKGIQHLIGGRT